MNSLITIVNSGKDFFNNDLLIEFLRSCPAWIALIITLVVPLITKKIDIEKANKQFLFQEKYKSYVEHFCKLHKFNHSVIEFLAQLNQYTDGSIVNTDDIEFFIKELYTAWHDIKHCDAKLWIIAPKDILKIRTSLSEFMLKFSKELNNIKKNNAQLDKESFIKLIEIAHNMQTPLSDYIGHYRKELQKL